MKKFFLLSLLFLPTLIFSQTIDWIKIVGDIDDDFGQYVYIDSNGFIYTEGNAQGTCDFGSNQLVDAKTFNFVAKYDTNGNNIWATRYDWSGTSPNGNAWYAFFFRDFKVTKNGEGILVGTLNDNSGEWGSVVRFSNSGSYTQRLISQESDLINLDVDSNSNFFVAGNYTTPQSFVSKFSPNGSPLWNINVPIGTGKLFIKTTADNGFIISNLFSNSVTIPDRFGDSIVLQTQDILGTDRYVAKYNNDGKLLWAQHYSENLGLAFMAIDPTTEAFYLLTVDNTYYYLERVDSAGNHIWTQQLINYEGVPGWLPRLLIHSNNLYFLAGGADDYAGGSLNITLGVLILNRYDMNGNLLGQLTPPDSGYFNIIGGDLAFLGNDLILTGGIVDSGTWDNHVIATHNQKSGDFFLAKMGENNIQALTSGIPSFANPDYLSVSPNPTHDAIHLRYTVAEKSKTQITVLDLVGNIDYQSEPLEENGTITRAIDANLLSRGMYIVRLKVNGAIFNRKICIE